MRYVIVVLLLLLCLPAGAEGTLKVSLLGQVTGVTGTVQVYLAESAKGKLCVLKVLESGKTGEANVWLQSEGIGLLEKLAEQALADRETLKSGDIVLLGSVPSAKAKMETVAAHDKLDVALVKINSLRTAVLGAHEGAENRNFGYDRKTWTSLKKLLEKAIAAGV